MNGNFSADNRPAVLYLFPGPRWYFEHEFDARLESLQAYVRPYFFTSTDFCMRICRGGAELRSFDYRKTSGVHKLIYYFRFLSVALSYAREIQAATGRLDAIVTYDPLVTGLMGRFIGWRLKSPTICEISGCYGDKELYVDRPILGPLRRRLNLAIIRWVTRQAAGVKKLFDEQLSNTIDDSTPILCLFDHVSTERFYRSDGEKIILAVGAPFFPKGFGDLVMAFQQLPEKYSQWRLRIVGHFVGDYEEIRLLVDNHPGIEICKAMMPEDIPHEMARADIFVLPSRSEAMGRVLLEAMAAGKPRIGSRVGGIPTVINDDEDGLLFDVGDIDQLSNKLELLMSRPDLRKTIGDSALKRLNREFTVEEYSRRYSDFIMEIVGLSKARPDDTASDERINENSARN